MVAAWATARFDDGGLTRRTARQAVVTAGVISGRTRSDFGNSWFGRGRGGGAVVAAGVVAARARANLAQRLLGLHRKRAAK